MKLMDFELNFWELYKDNTGMYLKIFLNNKECKYIILDEELVRNYNLKGKDYIGQFSSKICRSFFKNEYEMKFKYHEISEDKKKEILNLDKN